MRALPNWAQGEALSQSETWQNFCSSHGKEIVEVVKIVWLIQNVSGPWEKRLSKIRSTQNKASRSGGGGGHTKNGNIQFTKYICV